MKTISLEEVEYILPRYRNIFKKMGIDTVNDLLKEYPIKYENFKAKSIKEAKLDEVICLEGSIQSKVTVTYLKSKLTCLSFLLDVEGSVIRATLFNRTYLKSKLDYGTVIKASGKFVKNMNSFTINELIFCDEIDKEIVPIYKCKDISDSKYIEIIDKVLRRYIDLVEETIPLKYLQKHNLVDIKTLTKILHNPSSIEDIEKAYKRLKYEELLKYQVSMKYLHMKRQQTESTNPIFYKEEELLKLKNTLPYNLTNDQEKVINEILYDLKAKYPMNRLLQGEVGSGKTIVAIFSILACVSGGYQAALMTPTEILSYQHFNTLKEVLKDFNLNIEVLTGSTSTKQKKEILDGLKKGTINVVVGTHALFQKDVEYEKLGIVIADEEHRFGVKQRVLIRNKGNDVNYLKMSATPIPRTLSISAYGDMDISIIKEMPKNRKTVITKYVDASNKKIVMDHIKQELKQKHQIYVVTPLINESEALDSANAIEIYEKMVKYFKDKAFVGLIHGKLTSSVKEQIMSDFLNKKIDILVATSVIEVGVNVLNATTILILGAERFGLATLHQLRGRVMRSDNVPYCFLLSNHLSENTKKRLEMLETTSDGFLLAEYDLINRGPGEFFGEKQSGAMNFSYADLKKDIDILLLANQDADELVKSSDFYEKEDFKKLYEHAEYNYKLKMEVID